MLLLLLLLPHLALSNLDPILPGAVLRETTLVWLCAETFGFWPSTELLEKGRIISLKHG